MNQISEKGKFSCEVVKKNSNVFLGMIGALAGALIGAVLWIGLYQIGIIASIAGIAIIYLACRGYGLLSGNLASGGVFISIIISVLVLAAAHFFCWGLEIYRVYTYTAELEITFMDAVMAVPSIAFTEANIIDFVKELVIGLLLIGIGAAPFIRQTARINRLNEE